MQNKIPINFCAFDPALEPRYQKLMQVSTDPYYQELKEAYQNEPRVKFVYGEC